jgi:hypothetical protein
MDQDQRPTAPEHDRRLIGRFECPNSIHRNFVQQAVIGPDDWPWIDTLLL